MAKSFVIVSQMLSFFHVQLTYDHSNQSTDDHYTLLALPAQRWPHSCLLKASRSWRHMSPHCIPLWTSCATQNMYVRHSDIFIHMWKHFKGLWWSLSQSEQKCQLHSFLGVRRSFLTCHSWMTWKRGGLKIMWKKKAIVVESSITII